MPIDQIATYVWTNSQKIEFGDADAWNENLFTARWSKGRDFEQSWKESKAGWYWFLVAMSYDELKKVAKPQTLPERGCDIGLLSHDNRKVFDDTLLCTPESGVTVIYNGHESNVTRRIRAHFALNNKKTGALGLRHYPLSHRRWIVRYFSTPFFSNISRPDRSRIELLMNSYSGRCAVESAWRVKYGWPILCKE